MGRKGAARLPLRARPRLEHVVHDVVTSRGDGRSGDLQGQLPQGPHNVRQQAVPVRARDLQAGRRRADTTARQPLSTERCAAPQRATSYACQLSGVFGNGARASCGGWERWRRVTALGACGATAVVQAYSAGGVLETPAPPAPQYKCMPLPWLKQPSLLKCAGFGRILAPGCPP